MIPVIALILIPNDGAVLNTPTIYKAAHLGGFPNDFRGYERGALE